MNKAQLHALTHPLNSATEPRPDVIRSTRADRGANLLVVMLAVDR